MPYPCATPRIREVGLMAAARGNAIAEDALGGLYYNGQGVPQDYTEAYKWFLIAKATMPATARRYAVTSVRVKLLAGMMTAAQIAQAQQEATAWYAAHQRAGQSP